MTESSPEKTLVRITTDWQLGLMIAAAAVRMPSWDYDGNPVVLADSLPDIDRALVEANREISKLRDALRFIANHEAEPGSALETVVKFARLTLGEDGE